MCSNIQISVYRSMYRQNEGLSLVETGYKGNAISQNPFEPLSCEKRPWKKTGAIVDEISFSFFSFSLLGPALCIYSILEYINNSNLSIFEFKFEAFSFLYPLDPDKEVAFFKTTTFFKPRNLVVSIRVAQRCSCYANSVQVLRKYCVSSRGKGI